MASFHVRVHWSRDSDWSGWYEADTPGAAVTIACKSVACREGLHPDWLAEHADFTVKTENSTSLTVRPDLSRSST